MNLEIIQNVVRQTIPDGIVDSARLDSTCGCYSEWTTESCRFEVEVTSVDFFSKEYTYPSATENDLEKWARNNEYFSGCSCCSGVGHEYEGSDVSYGPHNSYLSVWVRLTKRD